MKKFALIALCISINAHATKGLIGENVLAAPSGNEPQQVANPKIGATSIIDLNHRTDQPMALKSLNATQEVFDESDPFANTLVTNYLPNKTIKVRVREFMGTLIILPDGDRIRMFKLGDTDNFTFEPSMSDYDEELPNSGTASVTLAGADTSLHIIGTSGNHYTFYLRGDTFESRFDPTMKVIVKDEKLLARLEAQKRREAIAAEKAAQAKAELNVNDSELERPDYLEKVEFDPTKLDFGYRIKGGDESLRPFMVYSDGYFTYFRFSDENSVASVQSFPVVYMVADGSDIPVNVTAQGSTLRAEGVANSWTLRLGESWLCIEKMIALKAPNSSMNVIDDEDSSLWPL